MGGEYRATRGGVPGAARLIIATPAAHGDALLSATLAFAPEDFRVDERLGFEPTGEGEHLWLRLEKRLLNTADVVALLERVYAVGSADVGVSGLKDRRAVTRQWFSVRTANDAGPLERALVAWPADGARATPADAAVDGVRGDGADERRGDGGAALGLLAAVRHPRKLRRGTHVANDFDIVLRDVALAPDAAAALGARLDALGRVGFPNYLGPQRFGRDGRNVERARAWFRAPRRRTSRAQRGLWLSAARSALFNRVCAARVTAGNWSTLLDGEPVALDGSRSFFRPGERASTAAAGSVPGAGTGATETRSGTGTDASLADRLERGDVHPSGPWWGRGETLATGDCAALERDALAGLGELREGLERAGLEQERRALRARPTGLRAERLDGDALRLRFALAPGVFATTLLAELGPCARAAPATASAGGR